MRKPLRRKATSQGQVSVVKTYPAPLGGLNARDALAAMPATDALSLDNWFPKTSYLEIRGGWANHLTGMTGAPKTLCVYNQLSGTNKLYAVTDAGVFDASSAGAVGSNLAARTNGKHQWLNYGDGTNNYLMMFNGVDKPLYYNGTTWTAVDALSSPALTGLTTTNIISAFQSKGRLFFIEKTSLSFWYLAAGAAGGALTEFPLDGIAKKGGYLMAGATWTFDGGDGIDDAVVFITSEGEVIIYKGTNPGSAAAWLLVGVFELGKPLGRRCFTKYAGDLICITQNGAFPLSSALQNATIDERVALTNKIENLFNVDARSYGSTFGWEAINYPAQSALIFNVPHAEGGEHEQYVMNTITKSWCKFTEWDAETFAVFNNELYFATSTKVVKAWTGQIDGAGNIEAYGKTSFSYFENMHSQKIFTMFRPVLAVNGSISFLTDIDVDFKDDAINGTATYASQSTATWDTSLWDVAVWGGGQEIVKTWTSPNEGVGYCAAGKLKVSTNSLTVQWMSNDFLYQKGGVL